MQSSAGELLRVLVVMLSQALDTRLILMYTHVMHPGLIVVDADLVQMLPYRALLSVDALGMHLGPIVVDSDVMDLALIVVDTNLMQCFRAALCSR